MLSNKEYYAPVLNDKELFEESKEKFDASTTNQNPQEASTSDEPQASNDGAEGNTYGSMTSISLQAFLTLCCYPFEFSIMANPWHVQ